MNRHKDFPLSDSFSPFKILTYPEVLHAIKHDAAVDPINIEINPTNICNESCTWCTYGYLHDRREFLPAEVVASLLSDSRKAGAVSVTWTGGGEPTVYRPLVQMIGLAADLGFRQGINTNGTRLSSDLMHALVQHCSYARFSVDAGTPANYARTHRVPESTFQTVCDAISTLVRERTAQSELTVGFSFLVDNSNVSDLMIAATLARSLGADYFQIKPIVHYVESNLQFAEHSQLWRQMEAQLPEVFALETDRFAVHYLGHKFKDIKDQTDYYGRTYDRCRGNELLVSVGADGSVDLCCAYKGHPEWSFGNLNAQSFEEIWHGERRKQILQRVDVRQCPPLCKAHEMNKIFHYVRHFSQHREFV